MATLAIAQNLAVVNRERGCPRGLQVTILTLIGALNVVQRL